MTAGARFAMNEVNLKTRDRTEEGHLGWPARCSTDLRSSEKRSLQ